ncbi:MAG: type II toxin-antitoxin system Phd/YefM family antitoxin [Anaerolineales bacterium]|nr:type II toxin-antitoxin system Phd/YefM family antitoxin [Anaerolineales bacterium]
MPTVGVRELKNQTTQVVFEVREKGAEYVITYRSEPVAIMCPLTDEGLSRLVTAKEDDSLEKMKALSQKIAAAWTSEKSGVELISEQRR